MLSLARAAIRLTRWVGRLKAKEILMLGEQISGSEAAKIECLANRCGHMIVAGYGQGNFVRAF